MKQPKIKIFNEVYDVVEISFENGKITKIIYEINKNVLKSIFKGDTVINDNLTSEHKIQKPTKHPYHDFTLAPNLEDLLIK